MKKLPIICLLVAVMVVALVPAAVFAETHDTNIRLINPVALVSIGNDIFVADNVDTNQSVILCFDISADAPTYKYTTPTFNKKIVNLAEIDGKLCIVWQDEITTYTLPTAPDTALTLADTYAIAGAKDFTYGTVQFSNDDTLDTTAWIGSHLSYQGTSDVGHFDSTTVVTAGSSTYITNLDESTLNDYFYFVYDGVCRRYNGKINPSDTFNSHLDTEVGFEPIGTLTYTVNGENRLALYSQHSAYFVQSTAGGYDAHTALIPTTNDKTAIVDMCYGAGKIFLLSANRIDVYAPTAAGSFTPSEDNFIGTDEIKVDVEIPTEFTSFTLAKSLGYPTNIIYKTEGSDSIDEILTHYTGEFIVLGFDGSENIAYYYVLVDNRFGWVKKSDGADSPQDDAKINVVDNRISNEYTTYTGEFTSLGAVHLYTLPITDYSGHIVYNQQTSHESCTKLQLFTEKKADGGLKQWYYVEYGEGQRAFIPVTSVTASTSVTHIPAGNAILGNRKINSTLFRPVTLYETKDFDGKPVTDKNKDPIKLYSGTRVRAILEEGDATLIQVVDTDYSGWVPSNCLIGPYKMTTNAIVGTCLLAAAVVLTVILVTVFSRRKKHKTEDQSEE